jgi:cell filamentation protein
LVPNSAVRKGGTVFAEPQNLRKAFNVAMGSHTFGTTLGHLAYCHPFLDGNGRAIFTFFDDHLRRKGRQLAWDKLEQDTFLLALDRQINHPKSSFLDDLMDGHITLITTGSTPRSPLLDVNWFSRKPK